MNLIIGVSVLFLIKVTFRSVPSPRRAITLASATTARSNGTSKTSWSLSLAWHGREGRRILLPWLIKPNVALEKLRRPLVALEKTPRGPWTVDPTDARRVRAKGRLRPALDPSPSVEEVGPQREGRACFLLGAAPEEVPVVHSKIRVPNRISVSCAIFSIVCTVCAGTACCDQCIRRSRDKKMLMMSPCSMGLSRSWFSWCKNLP